LKISSGASVLLGVGPVRDLGLLDSAVARPRARAFGSDIYPTLALQAAALLQSLIKNHSLVDGNKRLGWLASNVFIDLNRHRSALSDEEAFLLVMRVADGTQEVEAIAEGLRLAPR